MCGISGLYQVNVVELGKDLIENIVIHQSDRGPDSTGLWSDDTVVLAHNRLSIIDLSADGNQPMESDIGVIVFNGEIYNYIEIKDILAKCGVIFKSSSDTEVLLKCIDYYGITKALVMINGMFAFAYYSKIDKRLTLVRDRLGLKPLYYTLIDNNLIFASNIGAIIKSCKDVLGTVWYLNYESVYNYFLMGGCDEGDSIIKGVVKLESGHYITYYNGIVDKTRYWQPKPNNECINKLLIDSISIRKRSDVPISLLFSGGIDSSFIAYYCSGYNAIHLCTDETIYAKEIGRKLGLNLACIDEDGSLDLKYIDHLLTKYTDFSGEPSHSCSVPMIAFDKLKNYSKVGLSGNGGDELFYGYDRTPMLSGRCDILKKLTMTLQPASTNYTIDDYQILHIFRHPMNFEMIGIKNMNYQEMKSKIYDKCRLDNFSKDGFYRWLELNTYVKNDLNPTLDYASMAFGLEIRVPFLDYRVVERALTLTSDDHISNKAYPDSRKNILKKVLSNKLDEKLYNRTKRGFSLPPKIRNEYYKLGEVAVQKLIDRNILKSVNCIYGKANRDAVYIKQASIALEKWFQLFVDTKYVKTT